MFLVILKLQLPGGLIDDNGVDGFEFNTRNVDI